VPGTKLLFMRVFVASSVSCLSTASSSASSSSLACTRGAHARHTAASATHAKAARCCSKRSGKRGERFDTVSGFPNSALTLGGVMVPAARALIKRFLTIVRAFATNAHFSTFAASCAPIFGTPEHLFHRQAAAVRLPRGENRQPAIRRTATLYCRAQYGRRQLRACLGRRELPQLLARRRRQDRAHRDGRAAGQGRHSAMAYAQSTPATRRTVYAARTRGRLRARFRADGRPRRASVPR